MAISAAFHSIAVWRLNDIPELPEKERKLADQLKELFDNSQSSRNLRLALKSVTPPAVPYLGMYLTDLAMIDEAVPDPGPGLINFRKWFRIGGIIQEIMTFAPYASTSAGTHTHTYIHNTPHTCTHTHTHTHR